MCEPGLTEHFFPNFNIGFVHGLWLSVIFSCSRPMPSSSCVVVFIVLASLRSTVRSLACMILTHRRAFAAVETRAPMIPDVTMKQSIEFAALFFLEGVALRNPLPTGRC